MDTATDDGAEFTGSELDRLAALLDAEDEDPAEAADSQADDEDADDESPEGEDDDDADSEDDSDDAKDTETYTLKVDGKERTVTRDELIALAQKSDAAGQRFEEAAEIRKQADAERQHLQAAQQQALTLAKQYQDRLSAQLRQFDNVDWERLIEEDMQTYTRVKHQYDALQAEHFRAEQERVTLQQQHAEAKYREHAETLHREAAALLKVVPEWKDTKVANAERSEIAEWLGKRGYSRDEISSITDHKRMVEIRDAWLLAKLRDKKSVTDKKVKNLPPPPPKSGGRAAPEKAKAGDRAQYDRAKQTGRVQDAANALAKFL